MATWIIGDVQGCSEALDRLLASDGVDRERDRFWFVGDLVNRGPDSAGVLRRIRAMGDQATVVLGNHDLHLIGVALGVRRLSQRDTVGSVLEAADGEELVHWLRRQPVIAAERGWLVVHAGLHPSWTWRVSVALGREIEPLLMGTMAAELLAQDAETPTWDAALTGMERWRAALGVLTRVRMFDSEGRCAPYHGPLNEAPEGLHAWFDAPDRRWTDRRVAFGHWAALGVMVRPDVVATDAGCVWGRKLCAVRAEDGHVIGVEADGCA